MNLILTIKRSPEGVSLDQAQRAFDEEGGDIGRAEYNSWVLKDTERFISSRHCSIQYEAGTYFLVDRSTNGTFLGDADQPIGNGERCALSEGMSFSVGDYEFEVAFGTGPSSSPAMPVNDSSIPGLSGPFATDSNNSIDDAGSVNLGSGNAGSGNAGSDNFGSGNSLPLSGDSSLYEPIRITPHEESIIPGQENILDPLRVFDELNRKKNPGLSPDEQGLVLNNQADHAPLAEQAFIQPKVSQSEMIPDDWDNTEYGFHVEQKRTNNSQSQKIPPGKSSSGNKFDFELEDIGASDDIAVIENKSKVKQKPVVQRQSMQQQVRQPIKQQQDKRVLKQQAKKPAAKQNAVNSKRPVGVTSAALAVDNNLLAAIGLDRNEFSPEQLAEFNVVIGQFVRHTVEGLLKVLRARSTIKNELRLGVTTVQPRDNNPMKFSADVDDALEHLFVRQGKAYLPPIASVNESFETILDHQVAVLAGMRAAFKSLIEKFDPVELTRKFEAQSGSGIFSGAKKLRTWEAYTQFYRGQVQDLDSSFQHLFGENFVRAYESQLVQLSIARKQDKQESEE